MILILAYMFLYLIQSKLVEYRFSSNFGQKFHDFSGNLVHSINGNEISKDYQDTIPSDRGAYFSSNKNLIHIPKSSFNNNYDLNPQDRSIIIWLNIVSPPSCTQFLHSLEFNSTHSLSLILSPNSTFSVILKNPLLGPASNDSANEGSDLNDLNNSEFLFGISSKGLIDIGSWQMIHFRVLLDCFEVRKNEFLILSYFADLSLYSNSLMTVLIGGKFHNSYSISGFIFSYIMTTSYNPSDFYSFESSSCPIAIMQATERICPSANLNISVSSSGNLCAANCDSCSESSCLTCHCESKSCSISNNTINCICPEKSNPEGSTCICSEGFYFDDLVCEKCSIKNCFNCISSSKCTSCLDGFNLESNSCECEYGSTWSGDRCASCPPYCKKCQGLNCIECNHGFFLGSFACEPCGKDCEKCIKGQCLTCKNNFIFKSNQVDCECPSFGYSKNGMCTRNVFIAILQVEEGNEVLLWFNESLSQGLIKNDFQVKVKNVNKAEIKFRRVSNEKYKFYIYSPDIIKEKGEVEIVVKKISLVSLQGSTFMKTELVAGLNYWDPSLWNMRYYLEKKSLDALNIGLAFSAILAVISDSTIFWNIFSSFQLISYVPMNDLNYTENLLEFFQDLNLFSRLPEISLGFKELNYTISTEDMNTTSSFTYYRLNADLIIIQFVINIAILIIAYILSMCFSGWILSKLNWLLSFYKYSYFIRFIFTCSVDVGIFSLIQLSFLLPSNTLRFLGRILTLFYLVISFIIIIFPFFIIVVGFKNKYKIFGLISHDFNRKWSVLYEEFVDCNSFVATQLHSINILRKSIFIYLQVFLYDLPVYQLSINTVLVLLELIFVFIYFPYKNALTMVSKTVSEISIFSIQILFLTLKSNDQLYKYKLEQVVILIISLNVWVQLLLSLIEAFKLVAKHYNKYLDLLQGKKRNKTQATQELALETTFGGIKADISFRDMKSESAI